MNSPLNRLLILPFLSVFLLISCTGSNEEGLQFRDRGRDVPEFSADSAYRYIEDQLEKGPRVPGSTGHANTLQYLNDFFEGRAGVDYVFQQKFRQVVYGDTLDLTNLIAAFNPQSADRILLCAHWDTRPRGEKDPDTPDSPIPGADDGASGVAILMELGRQFEKQTPPIGVDIVLFDGEDYGNEGDLQHYFLGSRYWAENPPVPGYAPRFGILLDMVGAGNAVFPKEGYSMTYAPNLVNEIWSIGADKGHGDLFVDIKAPPISDDHAIINRETDIPMIDIIHLRAEKEGNEIFAPHWHTQSDDIRIIDKNTLKGVGSVLMELIYNRL